MVKIGTKFVTRNCYLQGTFFYGKVYKVLEWTTDSLYGTIFAVKDDKGFKRYYTPNYTYGGEDVWSSYDYEENLQKILEE